MRQAIDAERSLSRYLADCLPDWEVWTARTISNEQRPYAVVKPMMVPQQSHQSVRIIDADMPFIVYMYPEIGATDADGHMNVFVLEEELYQAFFVQNAKRVPMFDYTTGGPNGSAIPWDEPGPVNQANTAVDQLGNPIYDYYRVTEYQTDRAQDADDPRRWSVTLTLRLAWRRHGKLVSGYPLTSVPMRGTVD